MEAPTFQDAVTLTEQWAKSWREERDSHIRQGLPWLAARDSDRAATLEQLARELLERLGQ